MMLMISDIINALEQAFPDMKFFNGCISKDEECVGVYARGNAPPVVAIGSQSSYNILPVTLLIHDTENAAYTEHTANTLYGNLEQGLTENIRDIRVIQVQLLDSCPVNIGRDDNNICEMTIRANIIYERR